MTTAGPLVGRPIAEEAQSHRAPTPVKVWCRTKYRPNPLNAVGEFHPPRWVIQAARRAVASASNASRRDETFSLRRRLFTCERTVCSEM
jgi:hypothetical protein